MSETPIKDPVIRVACSVALIRQLQMAVEALQRSQRRVKGEPQSNTELKDLLVFMSMARLRVENAARQAVLDLKPPG